MDLYRPQTTYLNYNFFKLIELQSLYLARSKRQPFSLKVLHKKGIFLLFEFHIKNRLQSEKLEL